MRALLIGLFVISLGGCTSSVALHPTTTAPVCKALIGPIHYNTESTKSRRHAGPALAPDLKARNQVGQNLRCPAYR